MRSAGTLAVVVLAIAAWGGCRTATQITVIVSTDARCADVKGTLVVVGVPGDIEGKASASSATTCDPTTGHIGALVITPSNGNDDEIGIKVVTGIGQPPEACVAPSYSGGCIVARRSVRFAPHQALDVPVVMQILCKDVPCGATETCASGKCVPADVSDPIACANGQGGCSVTGDDGGVGVDGGHPDGPVTDGGSSVDAGGSDAPVDAPATSGTLLVSDTASNQLYVIDTHGKVLRSFASPVANVTGVTFDKRLHDGTFWMGHDSNAGPALHQVGPSGVATGKTISYSDIGNQGTRGLDFALGAAAASDAIVFEYTSLGNGTDEFDSVVIATSARDFASAWTPDATTFNSGYWGVAMIGYSLPGSGYSAASRWGTRGGSLERWADKVAPPAAVVPLSTSVSRGLTMTPAGDLYVCDQANAKILHLDASGKELEAVAAPTLTPAGISFAP